MFDILLRVLFLINYLGLAQGTLLDFHHRRLVRYDGVHLHFLLHYLILLQVMSVYSQFFVRFVQLFGLIDTLESILVSLHTNICLHHVLQCVHSSAVLGLVVVQ